MGHRLTFDDYTEAGMFEEIRNHFQKKYGVSDIEYICPAFKIRNYFEIVEKVEEYQTKRALITNYLESIQLTEEEYFNMKASG